MKTLLIAEKPDQARSFYLPLLEKVSGERFSRKNGYFESESFYLSWFFGHLLEQIKPDEYDEKYKEWKIEHLPIIPQQMVYKYKGESQKKQGELLHFLCRQSDRIICGTDPDREGQGIFDTFIRYYKIKKPVQRLWATSLTGQDLLKAWSRMKDIGEYNLLSRARDLRADSDWLVGMNASRAYSIIGNGRLPVGRVLTATLALIVNRDLEIENYKESFYYQLKGFWGGYEFTCFDENGSKFEDRQVLESLKKSLVDKSFSMSNFKAELKTENPPKPFSLPDLQKEANRHYGFSLEKTLEIAQALYEKKLVTYPRTDSPYLPQSDLSRYHELARVFATTVEREFLRPVNEKPSCVKDTDSPHTALIITGERSSLSSDEEKMYELIRRRFVGAFMLPREFRQTDIEISDGSDRKFRASLRQDIASGFRGFLKEQEQEEGVAEIADSVDEELLRSIHKPLTGPGITEFKRTKPKYYTPATLITAMQTCGRNVKNEDARKMLSETKGIGTPATQAVYPEQLKKYEYIVELRGCYVSTPKGRKLISVISPDLKTPELTAEWEQKLRLVETGKLAPESYRTDLHQYLTQIIKEARLRQGILDFSAGEKCGLSCPGCTAEMLRKPWGVSCSARCGFSVPFTIFGKSISNKEVERLIRVGESSVIRGFKRKKGSSFDAKLIIKDEGGKKVIKFEFESIPCPKCGEGFVRFFDWGAACSERNSCDFKIGKTVAGRKLSDAQIRKLVISGSTDLIKGFLSSEKRSFNARLKLDRDKKPVFDFAQ